MLALARKASRQGGHAAIWVAKTLIRVEVFEDQVTMFRRGCEPVSCRFRP